MPKISVCATCYNHEKFLPGFVNSVRAQTMADWKLNVVGGFLQWWPVVAPAIAVFFLSLYTIPVWDDYTISLAMYSSHPIPVGQWPSMQDFLSLPDFWHNYLTYSKNLYMNWGGRYLAWMFTFPLLSMPRYVFAFVNAIMWSVLSVSICRIVGADEKTRPLVLAVLIVVLLDAQAVLWASGSFSYLYAVAPACCAYVLYDSGGRCSLFKGALFFVLGFLFVGGHELVAVTLAFYFTVDVIRRFVIQHASIDAGVFLALGVCVGAAACIFAPGNFSRFALYPSEEYPIFLRCFLALRAFILCCRERPILILFVAVIFLLLFVPRFRHWLSAENKFGLVLCCIHAMLVSCLTDWCGRVSWPLCVLLLIVILRRALQEDTVIRYRRWIASVFWVMAILSCVLTGMTTRSVAREVSSIAENLGREAKPVVKSAYFDIHNFPVLDRAMPAWLCWAGLNEPSLIFADFYGKDKVFLLDEWTFDLLHGTGDIMNKAELRLRCSGDWYASPEHDVLVSRIRSGWEHGQLVSAEIQYDTSGLPTAAEHWNNHWVGICLRRILSKDWTSPIDELVNGKVKALGVVIETRFGKYCVLQHRKEIDRSRIKKIDLTEHVFDRTIAKSFCKGAFGHDSATWRTR